jgi:hypothetical protein
MALNAGITDFAATSQGMINKRPLKNWPWNLFKHDLRHNFSDSQSISHEIARYQPMPRFWGSLMAYAENRSGHAFLCKEAINQNGNSCIGEKHGYGRSG